MVEKVKGNEKGNKICGVCLNKVWQLVGSTTQIKIQHVFEMEQKVIKKTKK